MNPIPTLPTRKVRGDAKLERLAPEQRERLRVWLHHENRTYAEIVQLIRTEFSLSVGKSAVAGYWRRHILPQRYREVAEDAVEAADLPEAKFSEASLKLVRMHAYTALASSEPDLKTAARLLETVRSADRLALARERFAFAQRRAAAKEKLAEEKRAQEAQATQPALDVSFGSRPLEEADVANPDPRNPRGIPGYSGLDRPKSAEIFPLPSPMPSTSPNSAQAA